MTVGFVLVKSNLGAEDGIIEKLREKDEVKDVFGTFGEFDIMVKVESANIESIREFIKWNIQNVDKIRSTVTLMKKETE